MTRATFLGREPALWAAAVRAVLWAAILFGLSLSEVQLGGVMLAVEALLALWTRSQVTPVVSVVEAAHGGKVLAGPANERATPGTVVRDHQG